MKKFLIYSGIVVGGLILLGLLYLAIKKLTEPPVNEESVGNEVQDTPDTPAELMKCTDRNKMCQATCLSKFYIPIVGPAKWVECINACKRDNPCKK